MHFLLSRTQAGPGRTVKQEQEQISRNHVQTFSRGSVLITIHPQTKVPFPFPLFGVGVPFENVYRVGAQTGRDAPFTTKMARERSSCIMPCSDATCAVG